MFGVVGLVGEGFGWVGCLRVDRSLEVRSFWKDRS